MSYNENINEASVKAETPFQEDWYALGPELREEDNDLAKFVASFQSDTEAGGQITFIGSTSSGHTIADQNSVEELGRTFHGYKEGGYFLPNDEVEQDRLDLQHHLFRLVLDGKLGLAPVDEPALVLDIATGTGIWALDFAEENPSSHVIGTDLSLIQPQRASIPNCEFVRMYKNGSMRTWPFDMVHCDPSIPAPISNFYSNSTTANNIFVPQGCFQPSSTDTACVFKQAFDNLNEGGYIEVQDMMGTFLSNDNSPDHTALKRCSELMAFAKWLAEAGFVDITEVRIPVPINSWPSDPKFKEIGRYYCTVSKDTIRLIARRVRAANSTGSEGCREYKDSGILPMALHSRQEADRV
ncbi:S-adenosyl-L-methionine-dependent methyltransferase [Calycina marina]|uniref:S-adenosyl-L-methionine-dependent methyltransferase n=1 Tax=Calycina marina TaxID=1763456 RepID=A0A9P7ZCB1_9HELO|nr:S-adenosyl-L-methionine-dependent methyltransferase [Calycina marina]